MTHTKGPWVIIREYNVHSIGLNRSVASCGGYQSSLNQEEAHLENVANAHLIAAAPDLLETCEAINSKIDQRMIDYWGPNAIHNISLTVQEIEALRAAIAKARGEAS